MGLPDLLLDWFVYLLLLLATGDETTSGTARENCLMLEGELGTLVEMDLCVFTFTGTESSDEAGLALNESDSTPFKRQNKNEELQ